jgi:hypothetical protein
MIGGSNKKVGTEGSGSYSPFVGLGSAKLICVNPSNEQYEKIVGRPMPYDLKYDAQTNEDGTKRYPYRILTHNEEAGYNFIDLSVTDKMEQSQAGNSRFIDFKGNSTWGASLEAIADNEKMSWFNSDKARSAKVGEVDMINLIIAFLRYSSKEEESQLMVDLKSSYKIDNMTDHKTVVTGLNKLFSDYKDNMVTLLYVVKEVSGKFYQEISYKNAPFFPTNMDNATTKGSIYRCTKMDEDARKRGVSFVKEDRIYNCGPLSKFNPEAFQSNKEELHGSTDSSSSDSW